MQFHVNYPCATKLGLKGGYSSSHTDTTAAATEL